MRRDDLYDRDSRQWRERLSLPPGWELKPHTDWRKNALFAGGDEHDRLRGSMTRSLTHIQPENLRRFVEEHAHALIDEFCTAGRADLVQQFSTPLPFLLLMRLFGLDSLEARDSQQLQENIQVLLEGGEGAVAADATIMRIIAAHVAKRRTEPSHDLISWMIADESVLSDEEISEQIWLMLNAGMGSTANLIANVGEKLVSSERLRSNLKAGYLDIRSAIRTTLWDNPPVQNVIGRWPVRDVALGGTVIPKDDLVVIGLAAANILCMSPAGVRRDSWTDYNEAHLSFGGGRHQCPAQSVGHTICHTAVETLFARLPDLALLNADQKLDRGPSIIVAALKSLHVSFTPVPPRARRRAAYATGSLGDQ
ncbi:cytochrome P450 [Streptomyces umbrinus]|uniref:Cytochrome P450 n=1 Tax=Streptomyces umbrinus TaxID=67370 RepID=A0ABU0T6M2_9ACTN|nr:hypothetical protein [Streptomyces umbrinus]MDQ1031450.1 cytochrome P450 [Streptomyces umbrinus]